MKKSILIFLLFLGCGSVYKNGIDYKLITICEDIINYPNKIFELKNNYTEFYKDEYLNKSLRDTNNLKSTYSNIKNIFNKNFDSLLINNSQFTFIDMYFMDNPTYKEYYYKRINKNIRDRIKIYEIRFHNGDSAIRFQFIDDNKKFYLYQISMVTGIKL